MTIRLTITLLAFVATAVSSFQNGDTCGVTSSDFLSYDYRSDYMVAGAAGCTLGDDSGCFCAPNLADGESLSEWQWQCNGVVNFGPASSKTCPVLVPVPKGLGLLESVRDRNRERSLQVDKVFVGTESQQQKMSVACDIALHPTGRPGDEVCAYSDCDEGGDHSAVCACVDLGKYGIGVGMEWVCMHATCSCGDRDAGNIDTNESLVMNEEEEDSNESSSSSLFAPILLSVSLLAIVALFN